MRSVARRLALVLLGLSAVASVPGTRAQPLRSVTYPIRTMGTYANIVVVTSDSAASWPSARRAQLELVRIDSLMSNWTTTSEVARINRVASSGVTTMQPEVARIVDLSLRLWRESDGAFDITVEPLVRLWGFLGGRKQVPSDSSVAAVRPLIGASRVEYDSSTGSIRFQRHGMKIDLGGIAKGYAVDLAAEALRSSGVMNALVDLTGNMFALGSPANAQHWRIGIRDPRDRLPYFARLPLRSGEAISTSGKYEQFVAQDGRTYGHILDPRTCQPAEGLISVTIVSSSALTCDAWDTPLFVLGLEAAKAKAREHAEFSAVLVAPGTTGVDTVWVESALRGRFVLEPAAASLVSIRYF